MVQEVNAEVMKTKMKTKKKEESKKELIRRDGWGKSACFNRITKTKHAPSFASVKIVFHSYL